jgi:protocatechuate 3,4-dioxygenase beta subunit
VIVGAKVVLILPRPRATVSSTTRSAKVHPAPDIVARGVTGSDGTFTFSDLSDGTYVLIAISKGNRPAHERVTVTQTASQVTLTLIPRSQKK